MAVSLRQIYLYIAIARTLGAIALALVCVLHPLLREAEEAKEAVSWIG